MHHHHGTTAIGQLAGVTGRNQTTRQCRAQSADALFGRAITDTLVVADGYLLRRQTHHLVGHTHGHGNGRDFVLEQSGGQSLRGTLLAGRTVLVHGVASDVVALGDDLGRLQHRQVDLGLVLDQPGIGQHVLVHLLHHTGNGLEATGDKDVAFACNHALGRQRNGLQSGGAKAVDGHAGGGDGATGTQCNLAGDVGTGGAFGGAATHDDVLHFGRFNAGARDRLFDHVPPQRGSVRHVEGAFPALGKRRAGGGNNYS